MIHVRWPKSMEQLWEGFNSEEDPLVIYGQTAISVETFVDRNAQASAASTLRSTNKMKKVNKHTNGKIKTSGQMHKHVLKH